MEITSELPIQKAEKNDSALPKVEGVENTKLVDLFAPEKWIFPIPKSAIKRLQAAEVEVVPQKVIDSYPGQEGREGLTLKYISGKCKVLINKNPSLDKSEVLKHEGFHVAGNSWTTPDGKYEKLEDSVIEILRVANITGLKDPHEVYRAVKSQNLKVSYLDSMNGLLLAMYATNNHDNPVDVIRLAEIFFDEKLTSPTELLMEITRKTTEPNKKVSEIIRDFL